MNVLDVTTKIAFTFGIIVIILTQWILLTCPEQYKNFYALVYASLFLKRFVKYYSRGYEMWLLDFCYYANTSIILQLHLDSGNLTWFDINFCMAMGPVMHAIVVFRNSLALQSVEKFTCSAIHALPPLCVHAIRYNH